MVGFDFLSYILDVGNVLQAVFAIFSLYGIYAFWRDFLPKRITLSIGAFTIRRRYFDVQNITNIVSELFFDGGHVPEVIRKEILRITNPKVKDLVKNKNND